MDGQVRVVLTLTNRGCWGQHQFSFLGKDLGQCFPLASEQKTNHVDNWTERKSTGLKKNELNRLFGFCRLKGSVLLQRKSFGSRGTGSGLIAAATGMRIFRTAAFGVGRIHSYLFLRTCSLFPPIRFSRTIMGKQQQQTKLDQGLLKHPGGGETYRIF